MLVVQKNSLVFFRPIGEAISAFARFSTTFNFENSLPDYAKMCDYMSMKNRMLQIYMDGKRCTTQRQSRGK